MIVRASATIACLFVVLVSAQGCSNVDLEDGATGATEDVSSELAGSSCRASSSTCSSDAQCCSAHCERESFASASRNCCYLGTWEADYGQNFGTHKCSSKADCCGYMVCDYDWLNFGDLYKVCLPGGKGHKCIYDAECRSGVCSNAACT
jgi:hypothetical protein